MNSVAQEYWDPTKLSIAKEVESGVLGFFHRTKEEQASAPCQTWEENITENKGLRIEILYILAFSPPYLFGCRWRLLLGRFYNCDSVVLWHTRKSDTSGRQNRGF